VGVCVSTRQVGGFTRAVGGLRHVGGVGGGLTRVLVCVVGLAGAVGGLTHVRAYYGRWRAEVVHGVVQLSAADVAARAAPDAGMRLVVGGRRRRFLAVRSKSEIDVGFAT
jgi:hypothetical protein